jgi:plastocyanin
MNRITRSLFALTLVGALAACAPAADEPSASPEPSDSPMSMSMAPAPSAAASSSVQASASADAMASHDMGGMGGDEVMVSMENFVFVEDRIEVSVGTTVTWTNADSTRHTVTSGADDTADGVFDSDDIEAGGTFSHTFEEAGEFAYFCDIHPTMTGVVVVTP